MYEVRSAVINSKKNKIATIIAVILFLLIAGLEAIFLSSVLNGKLDDVVSVFAPIEIEKHFEEKNVISFSKRFSLNEVPEAVIKEEPKPDVPVGNKPMIALTFDDGPHPENTIKILDILNRHNAKATFFMLGDNVQNNQWIPRRVVEQGSEIGTHTVNHKNLNKLCDDDISYEISRSSKLLEEASGTSIKLFRAPYGNANENVKRIAKMQNKSIILWNIDTEDWKSKDAKKVSEHVLSNVKEGDIVLMHDLYSSTVEATEIIVEELTNRGYELVTISKLFESKGINLEYGEKYYYAK